ncbi:4Fe-4S cluster-binding domain-containing protein [Corynebacterium xerosis]|uniref:4Fe-4S cluster-binding domain-containing protein n=1 Tax=Corynebacterium xerosis TaxID=1725 RepID=A0A6B8U0A6_9CORY|nr:4Fe-4S cluster-binding domain-containing protein [Corynebacterium xerosis]
MHRPPSVRTVRQDINTKPFIAIWQVTRACGLVCKYCRADAQHEPHPDQSSTEEGKRLIDALSSYEKPLPLVVFVGGDPFEPAELEELTEFTSTSLTGSVEPRFCGVFFHSSGPMGNPAFAPVPIAKWPLIWP